MPILEQSDPAAVRRYTDFVAGSRWGNLMQDRGWAYVKKGWIGEQVYLEREGRITAALSIIFAPAVAGRTLAYAPRGPVCDPYDTQTIAALLREAVPVLKKHRAFLLRFDPETPYDDALNGTASATARWIISSGCWKPTVPSTAAFAWRNTRVSRWPPPSRCTTAVKSFTFTAPAATKNAT